MAFLTTVTLAAALTIGAFAQFPPTPEGITTFTSKYNKDITVSYKEVSID